MLSGKGKHGPRKGGKGSKDAATAGGSKAKEVNQPAPSRGKHEGEDAVDGGSALIIRTTENLRLLPQYSHVLARSKNETIGMEELDDLQLELESLLSCAAMRHRSLLDDVTQLEAMDERRQKNKQSQKPATTPPSVSKRNVRASESSRPPKKIKSEGKPELSSGGKLNRLRGLPSDGHVHSPKADMPEVPKNELPDKFWASVDPYCRPISTEDVAYLQGLIRVREEERNSELFSIPPLGRHYTLKWAEEENAAGDAVDKKTAALGGTAGPLTQRLVAALVEDRSAPAVPVFDDRSRDLSGPRAAALAMVKSATFESRVRDELREQGILDADEAPKEQADDELLLEMRRCQSELKTISSHNLQRLKHLLTLSETQLQRQELKNKLKAVNAELLKVHSTKQEKKQLSKKEKENAWRYIKEMKSILKELYPSLAVKTQVPG